ncbi:hypothetical protein FKP32DRAFT_1445852 [Trametes sanguinea]|nr:hypothetical protein FKP32DRAFT_1445852 [Trametes sanguinea]
MSMLRNMFNVIHTHTPHGTLLDMFYDLIEGVEYLQQHNIVHMEICYDNAMIAIPQDVAFHPELVARRIQLIDFDSARQFPLGSPFGCTARHCSHRDSTDPPNGLTYFDPRSWDVSFLGSLFEYKTEVSAYFDSPSLRRADGFV